MFRYLNAFEVSGSGTLKYLSEIRVQEKDFRDIKLHLTYIEQMCWRLLCQGQI